MCVVVEMIPAESLDGLMEWGKTRHGYLFRDSHPLPSSQSELICWAQQCKVNQWC